MASQTEYEGRVGHERKLHQTHFSGVAVTLKDSLPLEKDPLWTRKGHKWVRNATLRTHNASED